MLLFLKQIEETQMSKPPEATRHPIFQPFHLPIRSKQVPSLKVYFSHHISETKFEFRNKKA
jgi:hypothetical protein